MPRRRIGRPFSCPRLPQAMPYEVDEGRRHARAGTGLQGRSGRGCARSRGLEAEWSWGVQLLLLVGRRGGETMAKPRLPPTDPLEACRLPSSMTVLRDSGAMRRRQR